MKGKRNVLQGRGCCGSDLRKSEWICSNAFHTIICFALSADLRTHAISGSDCFAGINLASSEYFFCITRMTFSWKWQGLISARLWPRERTALQINTQAH